MEEKPKKSRAKGQDTYESENDLTILGRVWQQRLEVNGRKQKKTLGNLMLEVARKLALEGNVKVLKALERDQELFPPLVEQFNALHRAKLPPIAPGGNFLMPLKDLMALLKKEQLEKTLMHRKDQEEAKKPP